LGRQFRGFKFRTVATPPGECICISLHSTRIVHFGSLITSCVYIFVSRPKFKSFSSLNVEGIVVERRLPLVDCLIGFRNIRDRGVELSEVARTVDFWLVNIRRVNSVVISGSKYAFFLRTCEGSRLITPYLAS